MNNDQNNEDHDSEHSVSQHHDNEYDVSQQTAVISDEVLEHVYEDLNQLRELVEQDRETTQAMRQLIYDLKSKVAQLEAALKNKTKGE